MPFSDGLWFYHLGIILHMELPLPDDEWILGCACNPCKDMQKRIGMTLKVPRLLGYYRGTAFIERR